VIVVDTHAVIWLTHEQELLSSAATLVLIEARRDGKLAIADITLREIADQVTRGRMTVSSPLDAYLHFVETLFKVLPIDGRIAERSARFGPAYPKDPADRLIGATAVVYGARLVTKDEAIRASNEVNCVW
jgi:PIN domain nuclease of toxin-antitoxin system